MKSPGCSWRTGSTKKAAVPSDSEKAAELCPRGLSNRAGAPRGWEVVRGVSPAVRPSGSQLSHAAADACLHVAVLSICDYGRVLKLEAVCVDDI